MNPVYLVLAVIAGAVVPIQAGVNARAAGTLGHPIYATVVNFVGGAVLALVVAGVVRPGAEGLPSAARMGATPWWAWMGGVFGCTLVLFSATAVKPLGYLGLAAGLILGQLVCSVVLDHTGFLREAANPLTLSKGAGVALLVGGFWLINRS